MHPIVVKTGQRIGISERNIDVELNHFFEFLNRIFLGMDNFFHRLSKFFGDFDDYQNQNFLFRFDVIVETCRFDIHGLRDITHGHGAVAFFFEKLRCAGDDFGFSVGGFQKIGCN